MAVRRHVLRAGDVSVAVLDHGCTLQDWRVPLAGQRVPVVLGFADPEDYLHSPGYMGAIVGRVANRISGARFRIDGEEFHLPVNEPPNHLHGGPGGIHARTWDMDPDGDRAVRLRLRSPHLDQGYPGRLDLSVTLTLDGFDLCYDMSAHSDRPTPVNLAQHAYYNLAGQGTVADHALCLAADRVTPADAAMIPTGDRPPVSGGVLDFRRPRIVAETAYDTNFVLTGDAPAARLTAPNGMALTLWTDQPCLQLYTAQHLRPSARPIGVQTHGPFAGICLEPQGFPNAVNTPSFPLALVTPDRPYRQSLRLRIAPGAEA